MRRFPFVLVVVAASLCTANRLAADEKDEVIKVLSKELAAQREEIARLREENKTLQDQLRKIQAGRDSEDPSPSPAPSPKPPPKPATAIVGEWKHLDRAETLTFTAKGEWVQRLESPFFGPSVNRGTFRFVGVDQIEMRGGVLRRLCMFQLKGDTLILKQQIPVALDLADEFQRQTK